MSADSINLLFSGKLVNDVSWPILEIRMVAILNDRLIDIIRGYKSNDDVSNSVVMEAIKTTKDR